MKNLKKGLLATAIILVSAGSAFATNVAKHEKTAIQQGFRYDPAQPTVKCIATEVLCSETGNAICTWDDGSVTHQLYGYINDTMCGSQLYKTN